jgi:hypothetical protein
VGIFDPYCDIPGEPLYHASAQVTTLPRLASTAWLLPAALSLSDLLAPRAALGWSESIPTIWLALAFRLRIASSPVIWCLVPTLRTVRFLMPSKPDLDQLSVFAGKSCPMSNCPMAHNFLPVQIEMTGL